MTEYISREDMQGQIVKAAEKCQIKLFDESVNVILQIMQNMPAADVQPLSVVAEHIKNRLYETALNTDEPIARDAISDMAERIDFWIDELKDGDTD